MNLRIGIIGGSIAGCITANTLQQMGCNVEIFERSATPLQSRGAGIIIPLDLFEQFKAEHLFDHNIQCHKIPSRSFFIKNTQHSQNGECIWQQNVTAISFHWSELFANLRRRIANEHYHSGVEVTDIDIKDEKTTQLTF